MSRGAGGHAGLDAGDPDGPDAVRPGAARTPSTRPLPVRLIPGRFWLWAIGLTAVSGVVVVGAPFNGFIDFPQFWSAGKTVGTPDLLDPVRHEMWQVANGVRPGFFAYPPGAAWLFTPFALLPLAVAFWLNAAVIVLLSVAAGIVGARVYGLDSRVALVAALAWAPALAAAALGQNAPLALLLALIAIDGLRCDREWVAGLAIGAMLYKPTLALPLLALLLIRRRWTTLSVVALVAGAWYLLSVVATAGDWSWPGQWVAGLASYYASDTPGNVNKTISLTGLLLGHGAPYAAALGVAGLVGFAALPRLLAAPIAEAGAGACLVGLAISLHSLTYDAALVLPMFFWAAGGTGFGIAEPWRTRLLVAAYLTAPLYLVSVFVGVDILAVTTLAATAIWITGWQRQKPTPFPDGDPGGDRVRPSGSSARPDANRPSLPSSNQPDEAAGELCVGREDASAAPGHQRVGGGGDTPDLGLSSSHEIQAVARCPASGPGLTWSSAKAPGSQGRPARLAS